MSWDSTLGDTMCAVCHSTTPIGAEFCSTECREAHEVKLALNPNPWIANREEFKKWFEMPPTKGMLIQTAVQPPRPQGARSPAPSPMSPDIILVDYVDKVTR